MSSPEVEISRYSYKLLDQPLSRNKYTSNCMLLTAQSTKLRESIALSRVRPSVNICDGSRIPPKLGALTAADPRFPSGGGGGGGGA